MHLWTEKWIATAKALKLSVEGEAQLKICELTLDMGPFPAELAYGLPSGREQLLLLEKGDLAQVKFTPDAARYHFTAQYLGDRYMQVKGATVTEVKLTHKQDGDGVITVRGEMKVRFWWSDADLLFFAGALAHELEFQLAAEQLALPHTETARPTKAAA